MLLSGCHDRLLVEVRTMERDVASTFDPASCLRRPRRADASIGCWDCVIAPLRNRNYRGLGACGGALLSLVPQLTRHVPLQFESPRDIMMPKIVSCGMMRSDCPLFGVEIDEANIVDAGTMSPLDARVGIEQPLRPRCPEAARAVFFFAHRLRTAANPSGKSVCALSPCAV